MIGINAGSNRYRELEFSKFLYFGFMLPFDDFVLAQDDIFDVGQIFHAMFQDVQGSIG